MIRHELRQLANPAVAAHSARFFRTGPGEYGAGDRFLGIRVPALRALARAHAGLPLAQIGPLLQSVWHEERLLALFLLVDAYRRGNAAQQTLVARFYLKNLRHVNNWDLVDSSAPYILGPWLQHRSRRLLDQLSASPSLWRRRTAVLAAGHFIRSHDYTDTLRIATRLLHDDEDLIHKATGWMLREVGKRDPAAERRFLDRHAARMPRTMLRYAVEKFPAAERRHYLGMQAASRQAGRQRAAPRRA